AILADAGFADPAAHRVVAVAPGRAVRGDDIGEPVGGVPAVAPFPALTGQRAPDRAHDAALLVVLVAAPTGLPDQGATHLARSLRVVIASRVVRGGNVAERVVGIGFPPVGRADGGDPPSRV